MNHWTTSFKSKDISMSKINPFSQGDNQDQIIITKTKILALNTVI